MPHPLPSAPLDTDPRVLAQHAQRERDAGAARAAKTRHARILGAFIVFSALAAVFGGLALHASEGEAEGALRSAVSSGFMQIAIPFAEAVFVGFAGVAAYMLANSGDRQEWLERRARAEEGRLALHRVALEQGAKAGAEGFRAAADYLTHVLLAKQIEHLSNAANEAARTKRRWTWAIAGATGLGITGAALAIMKDLPDVAAVGALLVVLAPIALAGVRALLDAWRPGERAGLHETTLAALRLAQGEAAGLEAAVAAQDLEAALAWAAPVFDALSRDHALFLELMREAKLPEGEAR